MFGLLKMPKMPEIQNLKIDGFEESSIDINTLTYKDKALRNGIKLLRGLKTFMVFKGLCSQLRSKKIIKTLDSKTPQRQENLVTKFSICQIRQTFEWSNYKIYHLY